MRDQNGVILGTKTSHRCGPWAGGYATGFGITDDGLTMVHSTDVGGGYVKGVTDKMWRHVITYDNYDFAADPLDSPGYYTNADGVYAIDIAPSNGNIGYFVFRGRLFKTTDQFRTVQKLGNNVYFRALSNGNESRLAQNRLKIDPINPNVFLAATMGQGVYYSVDGGATLNKIAGLPAVTMPDGDAIRTYVFDVDRAGPTANGRKTHWAMWVPGSGVWETTTGVDGAWTKTANAPTVNSPVSHITFDWQSNLLMACTLDGTYERRAGVWKQASTFYAISVVVFPDDDTKFQYSAGGNANFTLPDAPNNWTDFRFEPHYPVVNGIQYQSDYPLWLNEKQVGLFCSKLTLDPVVPGKVWMTHGTGIAWAMRPRSYNDPIVWHDASLGNDMIVTTRTVFTPSGLLLRAGHDKCIWTGTTDEEIDNPPTWYPRNIFSHGWSIDYVPGKPNTVVCCVSGPNGNQTGMSKDGGKTFTQFAAYPFGSTLGGDIAFVSETEGYFLPGYNGRAVRTIDGGQTWLEMSVTSKDGNTLSGRGEGWNFSDYVIKKNILASKNEPGVAYAYNSGWEPSPATTRGVYRKEANSTTFTQVCVGDIGGFGWHHWQMSFIEVPYNIGDLLLIATVDDLPTIQRSKDRGVTWSTVVGKYNGVDVTPRQVQSLGFGKAAPGSPYHTCRFAGLINGEYAIYETQDDFKTFTKVDTRPEGMTYVITGGIAGHPFRFGEWYYGVGQMGWAKASQSHILRIS